MKHFFLFIYFLFLVNFTWSQEVTNDSVTYTENLVSLNDNDMTFVKRLIELGDSLFFELKQPDEAFKYYFGGYDYLVNDAELNLKIGQCYLASVTEEKSLAIPYFLKALALNHGLKDPELYYNLGQAYHYDGQWDKALTYYKKAKLNMKNSEMRKVNKRIEEVIYGKKAYANPQKNIIVRNLGPQVNSKYSDFCPLIDAAERDLYFTSRRHEFRSDNPDIRTHLYESIYFSQRKDFKNWTTPYPSGHPLNDDGHTATVSISMDGSEMILYREGHLWISYKEDTSWSKPKKLPNTINSVYVETSACLNYSMDTLYYVSSNEDLSMGGLDIFMSVKGQDGRWKRGKTLGHVINTEYDEEGVALSRDGNTLYFSSRGHDSMGGYDVFKSTKDFQGNWSTPVNLGAPINSPHDDVYFMMRANGRHAYYSSSRKGGYGEKDIYRITIIDHKKEFSLAKKDIDFLLLNKDSINTRHTPSDIDHLKEVRETALNATVDMLKTLFQVSTSQIE
ncbi:tetratricopeptide repeat protein [Flammeovirga sp. OC4]|uniref:tetratricopeptide repeat protein n=1 Tax=Flammeovirga sp. OC4 TaxID=1382345 RepID=UPI0005C46F5F|nr:tetratricopeptide repeat protein [Flammeovirga sp. OC4]